MATKSKAAKSPKPGKAGSAAKSSAPGASSAAASEAKQIDDRVAGLVESPLDACASDENLQAVLDILRNRNEPVEVRLAALQSLQAASFSVNAFESSRGDYTLALRQVAEDPNPELRQRVLGLLAREKDGFAQKKLLAGLKNPEKALVPPEKALQLLSYDVHAETYAAARAIVSNPPNAMARREALRLLAADATSAPMFEKILRDKDERAEIRQIAASALQALKPAKLQAHARELLLDTSEYEDIQATSLTAVTQFGDGAAIAADQELVKCVDRLSESGGSKVKQGARRFLSKYGFTTK